MRCSTESINFARAGERKGIFVRTRAGGVGGCGLSAFALGVVCGARYRQWSGVIAGLLLRTLARVLCWLIFLSLLATVRGGTSFLCPTATKKRSKENASPQSVLSVPSVQTTAFGSRVARCSQNHGHLKPSFSRIPTSPRFATSALGQVRRAHGPVRPHPRSRLTEVIRCAVLSDSLVRARREAFRDFCDVLAPKRNARYAHPRLTSALGQDRRAHGPVRPHPCSRLTEVIRCAVLSDALVRTQREAFRDFSDALAPKRNARYAHPTSKWSRGSRSPPTVKTRETVLVPWAIAPAREHWWRSVGM